MLEPTLNQTSKVVHHTTKVQVNSKIVLLRTLCLALLYFREQSVELL